MPRGIHGDKRPVFEFPAHWAEIDPDNARERLSRLTENRVIHTIPLVGQPEAFLIASQPLTQRNVDQLIKWISLMLPALIAREEDKQSGAEPGG